MSLKRRCVQACAALALGAALAAGSGLALAQPAPAKAQAAAPDPRKAALVRRYLAAINFERNVDAMQTAMLPVIGDQMGTMTGSKLSDADRQAMMDIVHRILRDKMTPQIMERMVPIYAEAFSQEELEAMVGFYESPVGRSITAKIPALAPKGAEISRELMPSMMQDVFKQVVEHFCPGGKCPEKSPATKPS